MSRSDVRGAGKFAALPTSKKLELIDEWICNERDRYILKRKLLDGVTFLRLEEELENDERFIPISSRQIQTVVSKGIDILLKHTT